jgi:hypothetical protein
MRVHGTGAFDVLLEPNIKHAVLVQELDQTVSPADSRLLIAEVGLVDTQVSERVIYNRHPAYTLARYSVI